MDITTAQQTLKEAHARQRDGLDLTEEQRRILTQVMEESNRKRAAQRRMREQTMRDMGLTKVRGGLGGIYWE